MGEFTWPWFYNFPPFFTLQANSEVRRSQLQSWCGLVLRWARHNNQASIDVAGASSLPVFCNQDIGRTLPPEGISVVLHELAKRGNLEWSDKAKTRGQVLWLSAGEWADKIYKWAQATSKVNTVCTLYELTQGDESQDQEFYGLSDDIVLKALRQLQAQGKAEIIDAGDGIGVKFLQS
ncbi:ESCRT-II complex vps25 subunit [Trinorchestia longiramus]|nr:ESCRT-II complex vps25 subunit [Trinorchestia longiramus]